MNRRSPFSSIVSIILLLVGSTLAQNQPPGYAFHHPLVCKYQLKCPSDNHYFKVHVKRNETTLSCPKSQSWPSTINETTSVSSSFSVTVNGCSLPNTTLTHLLRKSGIPLTNVNHLQLENIPNASQVFEGGYFDGLSSMRSLYIKGCYVNTFPDAFFRGLTNLEVLHINDNRLTAVQAELFEPIPTLRRLYLGTNKLSQLDGGVFAHLTNLTLLNVDSNQLSTLVRDVFAGLRSLTQLDVSSNHLSSLADDLFHDLPLLSDLNLSFNNISNFAAGIFANRSALTKLRVNDADIDNLSTDWFSNMTSLRTLHLESNNVEHLPDLVFCKTYNLLNLTLNRNRLMTLDEHVFKDTPNLEILDLSDNKLRSLSDPIFNGLTKLNELRLNNNQLQVLNGPVFNSLNALTKLYLQNNSLTSMDPEVFSALVNLKYINLANNRVEIYNEQKRHSYLYNCSNIENINLRNNNVFDIYEDWRTHDPHLKNLDLSFNRINKLVMNDFKFLYRKGPDSHHEEITINLTFNLISEVSLDDSDRLLNASERINSLFVVKITLNNNPIRCDCKAYQLARYFQRNSSANVYKWLILKANTLLCSEPPRLINVSLTEVNFYDLTCPLNDPDNEEYCPENCDCFYRPVDNAAVFNCSGANVRHLPPPSDLTKFRVENVELLLANNNLTTFDMLKQWLERGNVTRLSLASNNIQNLDDLINHLPQSLKILELHDNDISYLDKKIIEKLSGISSLRNITLYKNPWKCDCDSRYLLAFLKATFTQVHLPNNVTCAENELPLSSLSENDLCKSSSSTINMIYVAFGASVILFGTILVLYFNYQYEIKKWLHSNNIFNWPVTNNQTHRGNECNPLVGYSHLNEELVLN